MIAVAGEAIRRILAPRSGRADARAAWTRAPHSLPLAGEGWGGGGA